MNDIPRILQMEPNLTFDLLNSAVNQLAHKFGPGAQHWPKQVALSCHNYHELHTLPPTMATPKFEIKAIDVLGLRVIEDSTLPDDVIVLRYGEGLGTRIQVVKLVDVKEAPDGQTGDNDPAPAAA